MRMRFCGRQSPFLVLAGITDYRVGKCNPILDVLLYGDLLSLEENKAIFLAVHDFILKSKRFQ